MKKILREWAVVFGIMGLLYFTGLHTEVAGFLQRIVLYTGIIQPDVLDGNEQVDADYNFSLLDINGKVVNFEQFRGKTVFLNFWATWCPPCIAEMPDIQALFEEVNSERVAFVMISQDNDFDKAKTFLKKKGYTLPVYQLASNLPEVYWSRSIPTTFVLSPEGKIITKQIGMAKYNTDEFKSLLTTGAIAQ